MLLVAILAILSNEGSLVGMEGYSFGEGFAFAERHQQMTQDWGPPGIRRAADAPALTHQRGQNP
jgi:hypothetical protein